MFPRIVFYPSEDKDEVKNGARALRYSFYSRRCVLVKPVSRGRRRARSRVARAQQNTHNISRKKLKQHEGH